LEIQSPTLYKKVDFIEVRKAYEEIELLSMQSGQTASNPESVYTFDFFA